MLVYSIFCDVCVTYKVFINIRIPGSQFDNYILLHGYIASFDTYFCSVSSQDTCGNIGISPYFLCLLGMGVNTL